MDSGSERTEATPEWPGAASHESRKAGTRPMLPVDGLRAALNFAPLNLSTSDPIGLWGYSGGGLATAWAAEMYAGYAPELNLVGAVLGSPVGDLGNTYHRLNGKFFSGLPTMVVAALGNTYPEFKRVIEERVTPEGRAMLEQLKNMTTAH